MVKISTVIQIIFAEKFVSQEFTIRAVPGLSGPTNTCGRTLGIDRGALGTPTPQLALNQPVNVYKVANTAQGHSQNPM